MTLLAIDPGRSKTQATIGYCLFTDKGEEIERGRLTWDELVKHRRLYEDVYGTELLTFSASDNTDYVIAEMVVENFVNNTRSRGGQTNGASEVIGAIELACEWTGTSFTRQGPDKLHVAQIQAQYRLPINPRTKKPVSHMPHEDSAYLHGFYYLVSKGVLQPKGLSGTI